MESLLKKLSFQIKINQEILSDAKNEIAKVLSEIIKDDSIPLFDRWCMYMEYSYQCIPISSSTISRKITSSIQDRYYDLDRYRLYTFSDIFEDTWVSEDEKSNPSAITNLDGIKETFEDFNQNNEGLVKEILNCGYSGFEYDW